MFDKVNISLIIKKHFSTFQDESTGEKDYVDLLIFIYIPIIASCVLGFFFHDLKNFTTILITSLSIFTGLLFNLLLLTYDLIKRNESEKSFRPGEDIKTKKDNDVIIKGRLLKQIFSNISYSILISIFAIVFLLLSFAWDNCFYNIALSAIIYFLVVNFFLTLLMVLKRAHNLLSSEF